MLGKFFICPPLSCPKSCKLLLTEVENLPFPLNREFPLHDHSVLTSDRAALVNVSIMRTFIKLRIFLAIENSLPEKVSKLEQGTNRMFKVVFERLDCLKEIVSPTPIHQRRKIGLTSNKKT